MRLSTSISSSTRTTKLLVVILAALVLLAALTEGFLLVSPSAMIHRSAIASRPTTATSLFQAATTIGTPTPATANKLAKQVAKQKKHAANNSVLKGKLAYAVSKFFISPKKYAEIFWNIGKHVASDWIDLAVMAAIWKGSMPLARWVYKRRQMAAAAGHDGGDNNDNKNDKFQFNQAKFQNSKTRQIANFVSELGILSGIIYAQDVFWLFLEHLDFAFVTKFPVDQWTGGFIITFWAAQRLTVLKSFAISRFVKKDPSRSGVAQLINRFLDVLIWFGSAISVLDFLSVQTGFALSSLLGLSSVGTLVFSLASQSLVAEFMASLAIQGTNIYTEGEKIVFDNGTTTGTVQKQGWLNTHVRRSDELIVRIPNSQIAATRVANVSRTNLSAVKQTLALRYEDLPKLRKLCQGIKTEIKEAVGGEDLVLDGTRPFRVIWRDYKDTYLEVFVLVYLRLRPSSNQYYDAQEKILQAIGRAMKANQCEFAYTDFVKCDEIPSD